MPEETFDFLGYTLRRCYSPQTGKAYLGHRAVEARACKRLCQAVDVLTARSTGYWQEDAETLVGTAESDAAWDGRTTQETVSPAIGGSVHSEVLRTLGGPYMLQHKLRSRHRGRQMHTTAEISKLDESTRPDQFIPVRKEDLFSALIKQGDLTDPAQRELFRRFARTLRTICHYEYSETLDRLRDDYYYFNPEVAGRAAADRAKSEYAYDDLIRSLDKVLKDANFEELPHEDVVDAHRKRTVPVEVKAEHDDFREVRFYKRGRHVEQLEVSEWFGVRRRRVEIEVFDDIVLLVAMKTQAEIGSRRELRILKRRKIVPGSVLLKYFRNIACGDLYALFPNARVVMNNFDKAFLGVPAIAGGIPILLKLYATISVLFPRGGNLLRQIWIGCGSRHENGTRRLDGNRGARRLRRTAMAKISTSNPEVPHGAR